MTRTVRVQIPNPAGPLYLTDVKKCMKRRGPPRIRMIRVGRQWIALEGSHRVTAARDLALPIIAVVKKPTDRMRHDFYSASGDEDDLPRRATAARLAQELKSWGYDVFIKVKVQFPDSV